MKKQVFALFLAAALLVSLLAACGGSEAPGSAEASSASAETAAVEASASEPEKEVPEESAQLEESASEEAEPEEPQVVIEYPLVEDEVVLTQWGSMYPGAFNYISTLSENTVIDELAKRTGVRVECTSVQGGPNTIDQFTLMISAGDLPDFIDNVYSCYTSGDDAAIADGVIIDLSPYLEEHAPDFNRLMSEVEGMNVYAHTDDGAVPYFLDVSRNANAVCSSGYIIRQDWLDDLGLSTPETFDELHDVLTAFKNDLGADSPLYIPRGVTGLLSDAYGCAVTYEPMAGAYPFMVKDGTVVCGYQTDEMKEFLKTMHQWYEEGLIWQDFVTDNMAFGITTSAAYNKFLTGSMGCAAGELADITDVAAQIGDGAVIAAIPDPTVNGEKNHLTAGATPFYKKWAISADCEDPELAVEFMNYLYTEEGCDLLTYGIEGESCVKNDDGSYSFTDLILNNPDGISYANAYHLYTFLDELGLRDLSAMRQFYTDEALAASDTWSDSRDEAWAYPAASLTAEENEVFSANFVTVSTYVSECIPKFVLGDMDVEADFDSFLSQIEAMGIDECTGYKQAAYDRYMARG